MQPHQPLQRGRSALNVIIELSTSMHMPALPYSYLLLQIADPFWPRLMKARDNKSCRNMRL